MPNKSHARKFNPEVTLDDAGAVLIEFCDGTKKAIYVAEALTIKRRLNEVLGETDGGEGKLGPFGCRCQTWHHRITGDGCEICNPDFLIAEDEEGE